jgi:hypothetical protein
MKKFFSIFAATALMLSFVACDKKDKSSDEPVNPDQPSAQTVSLELTAVNNWVKYVDACEDQGWWQIQAMNEKYYITLSNLELIDEAPGIYTAAKLDPDYSFIEVMETEDIIDFTAGKVTLAVNGDKVTIEGTLTGSDKKDYAIKLVYSKDYAASTMTFAFQGSADGITVNPSEFKPWDYFVVTKEILDNYGADVVASTYFSVWEEKYGNGAYYTICGSALIDQEELLSYCTDDDGNVQAGEYALVVWGAIPGGVTTKAAAATFTVSASDAANAPKKAPAKKVTKEIKKSLRK